MNVENIPLTQITQISGGTRTHGKSPLPVINLQQIKSIIYLGLKGTSSLAPHETHHIDTFA